MGLSVGDGPAWSRVRAFGVGAMCMFSVARSGCGQARERVGSGKPLASGPASRCADLNQCNLLLPQATVLQ